MVKICVFDAYGTLFDIDAAARDSVVPDAVWPALSADWRRKQLEYSWLRSVAGAHVDFWQVTQDALDWALEAHGLADADLREALLTLYLQLPPFPEVPGVLHALHTQKRRLAILSNGSQAMLEQAVRAAGFAGVFDAVLSVDEVGTFKPARAVYDMVGARFGTPPREVLFISSNGWDICAAAAYGFQTLWLNRANAPMDRLYGRPEAVTGDMRDLLTHLEGL